MWRTYIAATACLAALGAPSSVRAAEPATAPTAQDAREGGPGGATAGSERAVADATFVRKAAQSNQAEVDLANLALEKASSGSVKQFAERAKKDHAAAQQKLEQAAGSAGVEVPETLDDDHDVEIARLEKLDGDAFDEAYMTLMVQEHQKEVQAYSDQARAADGEIAAYARDTVPVLEGHLGSARSISRNLEGRDEERQGRAEAILTGGAAE